MGKLLHPGRMAPGFDLISSIQRRVRLEDLRGHMATLIFTAPPVSERVEALRRFQERSAEFLERGSRVVVISGEPPQALSVFARENALEFTFLSDPPGVGSAAARSTAARFGAADETGLAENAVVILDQDGRVRRTYSPEQHPDLPNPAVCLRALVKIGEMPRPWPMEENDWRRGGSLAEVVLIDYADYQCRPCRENHQLLTRVLPDYGDRVVLVHRHLPLKPLHPLAPLAAEAAESAGAQGRFWEMHDRLFAAEGALERSDLDVYAAEIGLDLDQFKADLDSGRFTDQIKEKVRRAIKNKIKLTPSLFINGIKYEGPCNDRGLRTVIDPLLEE